jgi:hypothetical protein
VRQGHVYAKTPEDQERLSIENNRNSTLDRQGRADLADSLTVAALQHFHALWPPKAAWMAPVKIPQAGANVRLWEVQGLWNEEPQGHPRTP